ncbi:MAG TPA: hypothetical protein DER01_10330 [Phycisphaerales bacterium]|nr:hypothetical protein [Phycisphaerales bacterium]
MTNIPLNPDDPLRLEGCCCPHCQYELKGATSCMCPECGEMFTVTEVRSNRLRVPKAVPWGAILMLMPGGLFIYWGSQCLSMAFGGVFGMLLIGIGISMIAIPWAFEYMVD